MSSTTLDRLATGNDRPPRLRAVAVVGLGYVGRPLALEFYRHGHRVVGYDLAAVRREQAEREARSVSAADGAAFAVAAALPRTQRCDAYVVAVPTPVDEHRSPDLSFVEAACRDIGDVLRVGDLVSFESTVHPGATRDVCAPILEARSGLVAGRDFHVAFSPERVSPGETEIPQIVKVVGGIDEASLRAAQELYAPIIDAGLVPVSTLEAAELTKIVENTQRDVNIAFMNEMNEYALIRGIDFREVLAACRTKSTFANFRPGLVGGHCIAVDPYYLLDQAARLGVDMTATASARATNDRQPGRLATRIEALVSDRAERPRVVLYGSTYKADIDDTRNSGSLRVAGALRDRGFDVVVVDRLVDPGGAERALASPHPSSVVVVAVVHERFAHTLTADLDTLAGDDGLVVAITPTLTVDQVPTRLELTALL
ncbi:nucleotide sugar dehydrogenase [Oerskovia jenensis]|uniref:nucleotide sugar dehydrogenase n=1 Tax=Oerskovia jenensis TaxID=162169 RepID=UPI0036D81E5A